MPAGSDRPHAPRGRPGTGRPGPVSVRPPMNPQRGRPPARVSPGLRIVHEDPDILVLDKPPGLITSNMPGEARDSVFDFVKAHVRRRKRGAKAWIIHRLDKEASGLLVFAKTEKAFEWLKEDFRSKRVHRLYVAVVEGEVGGTPPDPANPADEGEPTGSAQSGVRGTIQSLLLETRTGKVRSIPPDQFRGPARAGPGQHIAKPAVTHYRVLGTAKGRSLLQVRLQTGRKHQIRAHMSESGHPILGDAMYGASNDPLVRLGLHATELGFTHPTTGQMVRFHSPAPAGFYRAVGMKPPARPEPETPTRARANTAHSAAPAASTSWDHVAAWYDQMLEGKAGGSDHFERVILPGTLRLLRPRAGMRVLDIACGQGALCRRLGAQGVLATGVDAAPRLIEAAQRHAPEAGSAPARYIVGDARDLGAIAARGEGGTFGPFDAATCIMALMNIDPLEPVLRGCRSLLAPGGVLVAVILHPAFRAPGQTSWGWDEVDGGRDRDRKHGSDEGSRQFRRVDGYLSPGQTEILMNPGQAAHGKRPVTTWTFHRPIQSYIKALSDSGFLVESLEEWPSLRRSEPGPRASEENRARREIPMFLGLRAVLTPAAAAGRGDTVQG
jgi:23S rRNA-/tRNA-specific pseudouridylate synthase/2-polyprenyl-3-methyl-5-hydroxy-6-metoxy-1,4-benzoquinol methylase